LKNPFAQRGFHSCDVEHMSRTTNVLIAGGFETRVEVMSVFLPDGISRQARKGIHSAGSASLR